MKPGSLRAAMISWLRLCLGLGIFSIPFCISKLGWFYGILFLLISASLSYLTYNIIIQFSLEIEDIQYIELVKNMFNKYYYNVFKISLIIDLSSNYLVFPLLSWKLFVYITGYYDWIGYKYFDKENIIIDEFDSKTIIIRIIFLICCFIFSSYFLLMKKIENMKFISIIFLAFIIYFVILILIESIFNINYYENNYSKYIFKEISIKFFIYFSNLILSFYTQPFILDIKNELFNSTEKRVKKIYRGCTIFIFFLYLILGSFGYIGYDTDINDIVLISKHHFVFKEIFFFSIFAFLIILIISTPIYNPSLRTIIFDIYNIKYSKKKFILISLLPYLFWICIASVYPKIIDIFGLIGGIIFNFNGFITPILMKIKMIREVKGKNIYYYIYSFLLFIQLFLLLGTLSAIFIF